jgi:hypothetical protein
MFALNFKNIQKQEQSAGKYPCSSPFRPANFIQGCFQGYPVFRRRFFVFCSTCRYFSGIAVDTWLDIVLGRDGEAFRYIYLLQR